MAISSKKSLISFVIPTLNAASVLPACLDSISSQKIPGSTVEIIIADGGSTDQTLSIAQKHHAIIVSNPLKTAEAGKAAGIKIAKGDLIALIDSDNVLPHRKWLSKMLIPFRRHQHLIAAEPVKFTYRRHAGFIERYSALIGANDPYAYINGIYDRYSYLSRNWTGLDIPLTKYPGYVILKLKPKTTLPTLGANGTIFRSEFLRKNLFSDYLFDIDLITSALKKSSASISFAKVNVGIIHTFCESSIAKFYRKQNRRLVDYYHYQPLRSYDWQSANRLGIFRFSLYTLSLAIPIFHSLKGFSRQPDLAWFFHPLACLITLFVYARVYLLHQLGLLKPINRQLWRQ